MRDGVTHGVGTVARTGAWAVRGGAGMLSSDSLEDGGGAGGGREGKGQTRSDSTNIWDAEAGREAFAGAGAGGGGLVDEDGRDVSAIFGAIRNAQVRRLR